MALIAVLRTPGVAGPMVWSLLANLPVSALGLVLILHVEELTGRFAPAGAAAAAFAVGLGISAPVVGRLIDRVGQVAIVAPLTLAACGALGGIALLSDDAPIAVVVVLAGVVGLAMPPGGSTLRAMWTTLITDPDRRHAVFALHAACVEATYIAGPVLVAGVLAAISTDLALVASIVMIAVGMGLYVTRPEVRAWRGEERGAGFTGPLASPSVRALLSTLLLLGVGFGSVEVGVAAVAEASGHKAWAGPLLGVWGLGSMVGAVIIARRPSPEDRVAGLVRRLVVLAAFHALLLASTDPLVLAPLMLLAGVTLAPALTLALTLLGDAAPPGTLTEAFSWSTCAIGGGLAVGAVLGGLSADAVTRGPFVQACVAVALGAAWCALRSPRIAAGVQPVAA